MAKIVSLFCGATYPAMQDNIANRLVQMTQRPKLVNEIDALPAVVYAVGAFKTEVKKLVRLGLVEKTVFSQMDFDELTKEGKSLSLEALIEMEGLPGMIKSRLVYAMLVNIHDGWVHDYAEDFFGYFVGWEHFYLPIELAGVGRLLSHFEPVEQYLIDFGLDDVAWDDVERVYLDACAKMVRKNQIRCFDDLTEMIVRLDYTAWRHDIKETVKDRKKAFAIATQVMGHNPDFVQMMK